MQASFLLYLKKAKKATKGAMTSAANKIFQFHANLLLAEAKYVWNKIVTEQTASDPNVDLQGISQKGPEGVSCQSFEDCMLFHLLTMFPINAAEREEYYLTNVLKKSQRVSMHQFVHCVE
jgi:hypothetical protein